MQPPTPSQPASPAPRALHHPVELGVERILFGSRWLLAPLYIGLAASLALLLCKFAMEAWELVLHGLQDKTDHLIIAILGMVDISLMANLVLMVMFAGYENFVSRFQLANHADRPDWMGHVGFSELKLKLMASIVAISAIHLLESFMNVATLTDRELGWSAGLHLTFVLSGVLLACMDRFTRPANGGS